MSKYFVVQLPAVMQNVWIFKIVFFFKTYTKGKGDYKIYSTFQVRHAVHIFCMP